MRMSSLVLVLLASLTALACSDEQSPEAVKNLQIRQQIETTINEIEAKTRTKARGLGMTNAETASIEDVRAYVCTGLVDELKDEKAREGREALASDLTTYACRERPEWLTVLRATAKDQGLERHADATLDEARDFICRRIKESLRAVKKARDKETLETEGRVYDCIF